jgi:glycosyltransferase involved in cell wall biosynthesis
LYAAGPGDVIGTYRHWAAGRDDPAQVAVTYSGQFYDFCREAGAFGYVISSNSRKEKIAEGNLIIEHRPTSFKRGPALLYHLGQIFYGLRLVWSAILFRADVVIVADNAHWFVLGLLPWFGIRVVPTLHCVLWPKHEGPIGALNRFIRKLNARFFRRSAAAVLSLSGDITEQVRPMLRGKDLPIIPFLPSYRLESFGEGFGPPANPPPFRVFFAGRIEKNKGVFDLLEIAKKFREDPKPVSKVLRRAGSDAEESGSSEYLRDRLGADVEFDLCGDGSQLEALRAEVGRAGLQNTFRLHGHSTRPLMMELYERCHAVIVPTTSDFVEGFNKVVAEGVLAGRPVITSSVCPALEYVRDAVLEVPPDQATAYGEAILQLKNNLSLYETKRLACQQVRSQFYDVKRGWKAAVSQIAKRD